MANLTSFKYNEGCFIVYKEGESKYYPIHELSIDDLCNLIIDIQQILNDEQKRNRS